MSCFLAQKYSEWLLSVYMLLTLEHKRSRNNKLLLTETKVPVNKSQPAALLQHRGPSANDQHHSTVNMQNEEGNGMWCCFLLKNTFLSWTVMSNKKSHLRHDTFVPCFGWNIPVKALWFLFLHFTVFYSVGLKQLFRFRYFNMRKGKIIPIAEDVLYCGISINVHRLTLGAPTYNDKRQQWWHQIIQHSVNSCFFREV